MTAVAAACAGNQRDSRGRVCRWQMPVSTNFETALPCRQGRQGKASPREATTCTYVAKKVAQARSKTSSLACVTPASVSGGLPCQDFLHDPSRVHHQHPVRAADGLRAMGDDDLGQPEMRHGVVD